MSDLVAIYGGTFDPVTLGHLDLVVRGAALYGRLIVCVSDADDTLFTTEERVALFRECVPDDLDVVVEPFDGLLVERARHHGARILLRGIRGPRDLDVELPMAFANRDLAPEMETVFLAPSPATALVSSSLVREVAALGGDVGAWVSPAVAAALAKRTSRA